MVLWLPYRSHDIPDLFLAPPLIWFMTFTNHLTSSHLQIPFVIPEKNNAFFTMQRFCTVQCIKISSCYIVDERTEDLNL